MKQRIKAVGKKIKRLNSRINQYQQNRMFVNNQGRFFQRLKNEEKITDVKLQILGRHGYFGGIYGVKGRSITRMLNV